LNLAAVPNNAVVALSWGASSGATSYGVKRALANGGPYSQIATPTSSSYTDTAVTNGTTYFYVVSAVNSAGESSNSSQVSATPAAPVTIPATPTALMAVPGDAVVTLSWTASSGAASYRVKRALTSGGPYSQIATPTSSSYTDTAVANGTLYFYVVSATNSVGESVNSSQVSATPAAAVTIPAAPTALSASAGNAVVALSWMASSGAASYSVKRALNSGGPYSQIATPTSSSYTDTTVANGTLYFYVVSATNSVGESVNSSQVSATPSAALTIPAAPTALSASAGSSQVGLSWTASAGATNYSVKRATTSGGPYTQVAAPTSTSYTDPAVTNGTAYFYVVSAVNSAGESSNSSQVSATPVAVVTIPASPTALTASPGNSVVTLSWTGSSGATGYRVKRSTINGGPYTQIATPTSTSYSDTAVTIGTPYYYVVSATNSAGESGNSVQVTATPAVTVTIPASPTGLSASAGNSQVGLSWAASSSATGYVVKRALNSGGPYTQIASPTSTLYADTAVTNGTAYYYVVSATNSAGESGNSGQVTATPAVTVTIPPAPTALAATAANGQVGLSWNASTGATNYSVKRSTTNGGPYTQIATSTSTSYTDTAATNGTAYFYVVTATNSAGESSNSSQATATPTAMATLFFDDFSGPSIDSAKWTVFNRLSDQANGELNCVIPENVSVQNGILSGVSKFEDRDCGDAVEAPKTMHYTSWQIQQATAPFLYGTIEVRAKEPGGTGVWPDIWMLGFQWQASQPSTANTSGAQWPNAGWCEIDIAEFLNGARSNINTVVHFNQPGGSNIEALPFDSTSRFMVYRLQWASSALIWSVDAEDGMGYRTLFSITDPARIPNVAMYVVINAAIGGIGGGTPVSGTFPQTFQVDYVRVTQ
jgi:fibronectin type 3 domain-containing protein